MAEKPIGLVSSAASANLLKDRRKVAVPTPFGDAEMLLGRIGGREAAVQLRYG